MFLSSLQILSRPAACNKTSHCSRSLWSSHGTKYYVYGAGGDSLSYFCCTAAATTDIINNTAAAAAEPAGAAATAAAHDRSAAISDSADPASAAVFAGRATSFVGHVLNKSAIYLNYVYC